MANWWGFDAGRGLGGGGLGVGLGWHWGGENERFPMVVVDVEDVAGVEEVSEGRGCWVALRVEVAGEVVWVGLWGGEGGEVGPVMVERSPKGDGGLEYGSRRAKEYGLCPLGGGAACSDV